MSTSPIPSTPTESTSPSPTVPESAAAPPPEASKDSQPPALLLNSIVQRCCNAYQKTYAAELAKGAKEFPAEQKATAAYLKAMPYLTAHTAIRAYVACVAHAMLLEIIPHSKATKLLYAAQMARSGLTPEPRPVGRPRK